MLHINQLLQGLHTEHHNTVFSKTTSHVFPPPYPMKVTPTTISLPSNAKETKFVID